MSCFQALDVGNSNVLTLFYVRLIVSNTLIIAKITNHVLGKVKWKKSRGEGRGL